MSHLISIELAELRRHDLHVDAARARLAAEARRARRRRLVDRRGPTTRRWRRRPAVTAPAVTTPATTTPLARPVPLDDLATRFAAAGSDPSATR